jgi:hypothetical protein
VRRQILSLLDVPGRSLLPRWAENFRLNELAPSGGKQVKQTCFGHLLPHKPAFATLTFGEVSVRGESRPGTGENCDHDPLQHHGSSHPGSWIRMSIAAQIVSMPDMHKTGQLMSATSKVFAMASMTLSDIGLLGMLWLASCGRRPLPAPSPFRGSS